jgi:tetratricopeptide (TPR) repeat protein
MKGVLARISVIVLSVVALVSTASAREAWVKVRTANFLLIGNASERDIRNVAAHLELFRSALASLFKTRLASELPTNVVVFKDDASYTPYKPLKRDGKLDLSVQGYFESGSDVNYITVAIGRGEEAAYRTIFHEYVHNVVSLLYPKGSVPAWFNEGLAEYYSTFALQNSRIATVGGPISTHARLLNKSSLLPLDSLFSRSSVDVNNSTLDERSLFYAESWAFVHYLFETGRGAQMNDFVKAALDRVPMEQAFKGAFHEDHRSMETAFHAYVDRGLYGIARIGAGDSTNSGSSMIAELVSAPDAGAYLGDLLFHMDRPAEAEVQLQIVLKDDPTNPIANADLGNIRFQQQRFDEAKAYFKIAANHEPASAGILFRYAYVLSREGLEPTTEPKDFDAATAKIMRDALHRAIAISPSLTESYDLLATIDLATDENLDEAATAMQTASRYNPNREDYALRLADVYIRQRKDDLARQIAERFVASPDPDINQRANSILDYLRQTSDYNRRVADQVWIREHGEMAPLGPKTDPPLTRGEVEDLNTLATLRSINADLRVPKPDETRVIGTLQSVDCGQGRVHFSVRSSDKDLTLASPDFQRISFTTFDQDVPKIAIGCESKLNARTAVVTYTPSLELIAIEFVPASFRFLTADEMQQPRAHLVRQDQVDSEGYSLKDRTSATQRISPMDERSRLAILAALGPTAEGEKRQIGYLQGVECSTDRHLLMLTSIGMLRLKMASPDDSQVPSLVPDLPSFSITCMLKPNDYPVVVTYKPTTTGSGAVISLAIVPRDFKLD